MGQGGGPGAGEVTQLLSLIDVLVDGEFVEERKNRVQPLTNRDTRMPGPLATSVFLIVA